MGKYARSGPMVNRAGGVAFSRGVCPECHVEMRISGQTGKMIKHDGCTGSGQSPMKPAKKATSLHVRRSEEW